ncbi:MAG: WYL domain-containing transcriptional regulator [Peptostreptococcaceae bacterium]|nr:WYL domain-containing transcriptional regulator [Peptostreptococcaceae bacterium]
MERIEANAIIILCILSVLEKYSDADHILSMKDILSHLKAIYAIDLDRRTVYRNVTALIEFGIDISIFEDNKRGYYLREREFEPSELHLLSDAILSAEFIPEAQGKKLIQKLQNLGSRYQTKSLGRLAFVKTNKKSPNKEIFFNIEMIDEAIKNKKQIEFQYTTYDIDLIQKPRRKEKYLVSPYVLYWGSGQYYLISNLNPHLDLCHFRVDRIKNISATDFPVKKIAPGFDVYEYAKNSLFMFGGETESFTICCDRKILNDVVDQFGDKIIIVDSDQDSFTTVVKATTDGMRIWAIHYFESCKVLSPEWLVEDINTAIRKGMKNYGIKNIDDESKI